jgi:redox-sensitive bicupin YhaK (pirin superfamily)
MANKTTMKRKDFIVKSILAGITSLSSYSVFAMLNKNSKKTASNKKLKKGKTMNTVLHKADTRGSANHGWLQSKHTFSFANYYNPERTNFGLLRVLNDDIVSEAQGFGTHPHRDMEIISIPLEGDLEHKDSMGTTAVIKQGDIQVMSAGKGITHSEYNANKDKPVKFLQIWVFPDKKGVEPRYDQITMNVNDRKNKLQQVLSPNPEDSGVWIHQNAWFNMTSLEKGKEVTYNLNDAKNNGVYAFVIEGEATINGQALEKRDGFGVWNTDELEISADSNAEILLMEIPMN